MNLFYYVEGTTALYKRGVFYRWDQWKSLMLKLPDGERHQSVGFFAAPHRDALVQMPYVQLETETQSPRTNFINTKKAILSLRRLGVLDNAMRVRYSGNKSFHLLVPAGFFGSRYGNRAYLREYYKELLGYSLMRRIEPIPHLDFGLLDPTHLVRATGSINAKTGKRVTEVSADRFLQMSFKTATTHEEVSFGSDPFHYPPSTPLLDAQCELDELIMRRDHIPVGMTWNNRSLSLRL